jgi:DNA (cytosine-5)-methyltransferase 1
MARIIGEVRPRYAFIENSPMLTIRGLDTVLSDLATMGFNARWGVVSAADVGAPHLRERIWIVAHSNSHSKSVSTVNAETICKPNMAHSNSTQRQGNKCAKREQPAHANIGSAGWWASEPDVGRVANGVAARVDRLKAIGNGQVPQVVAAVWRKLSELL